MILTKLSATNFMKFRELELDDLPRTGLVGILGENEAGKSTIGHAICFALFGRTAHLDQENLTSLIRWGADFTEVELCFEIPGRGSFRVFRELDRLGEHLAQLEDLDGGRAVGGTYQVACELNQLLGYSYADFRSSLFMAQGELDQPRDREDLAASIDRLSGARLFQRAVALSKQHVTELMQVRSEVEQSLAAAQIPARIPGAAAEEATLLAAITDHDRELDSLRNQLAEREARVGRVRDRLRLRDELAQGLDRLAAMARARDLASRLDPLRTAIRDGLAALPAERASAALKALTARERQGRSEHFQEELARFAERAAARRNDLKRMLDPGRSGSIVDYRLCVVAEATHSVQRGQRLVLIGLVLAIGGVLGAILTGIDLPFLKVAPVFGKKMAYRFPDYIPYIDFFAAVLGVVLTGAGLWQRRQGRKAAARYEHELAEIDERIEELQHESQLLMTDDPLALIQRDSIFAVNDHGLREMVARLKSEYGAGIAMEDVAEVHAGPEAGEEIEKEEHRFHDLGAAAERLERGLDRLASYRDMLRQLGIDDRIDGEEHGEDAGEVLAMAPADETTPPARDDGPAEGHDAGAGHEPILALLDRLEQFESEMTAVQRRLEGEAGATAVPAIADVALEVLGEESLAESPLTLAERAVALERLSREMAGNQEVHAQLQDLVARAEEVDCQVGDARVLSPAASGALARVADRADAALAALPEAEPLADELRSAVEERDALARRMGALEGDLASCRAEFAVRQEEFGLLRQARAETDELESRRQELDADLEREHLAAKMLDGAAQQLGARVVPHLTRAIGRALGRITGGRYSRVEIGRGTRVRVYSDEKDGFVDPAELSSGTQSQIHLAVRLGFAEALLLAKGLRGAHFLFLDEPLGGFDPQRSRGFIDLLREFTPVFPQIFFAAGDTGLGHAFEQVVEVNNAASELRLGAEDVVPVEAFEHQT